LLLEKGKDIEKIYLKQGDHLELYEDFNDYPDNDGLQDIIKGM